MKRKPEGVEYFNSAVKDGHDADKPKQHEVQTESGKAELSKSERLSRLEAARKNLAETELATDYAVRDSEIAGKGLFALRPFAAGDVVSVYYLSRDEDADLRTDEEMSDDPFFAHAAIQRGVNADGDAIYVAVPEGNPRVYLNHSCDPNCMLKFESTPKDKGSDTAQFAPRTSNIVAIKPIKEGEELTIDYGTTQLEDWEIPCSCGAKTCRHKVTDFLHLPKERQEFYKEIGAVPDWMKVELEKHTIRTETENS